VETLDKQILSKGQSLTLPGADYCDVIKKPRAVHLSVSARSLDYDWELVLPTKHTYGLETYSPWATDLWPQTAHASGDAISGPCVDELEVAMLTKDSTMKPFLSITGWHRLWCIPILSVSQLSVCLQEKPFDFDFHLFLYLTEHMKIAFSAQIYRPLLF
jgi:hypothetical protein